jgi:hypothetical protein
MTRLLLLLFILAAPAFPGCHKEPVEQSKSPPLPRPNLEKWQAAFKRAEKIELYSILPKYGDKSDSPKFNNWPIVDSAIITDPVEKERLYRMLDQLIYDDTPDYKSPACKFGPHHGLSIYEGSEKHDLVICFTCEQVQRISKTLPTGRLESGGLSTKEFDDMEAILKAHGIETLDERFLRRKKEAELKDKTKEQSSLILRKNISTAKLQNLGRASLVKFGLE